ncbi:MAG: hypothetical protein ABIX01_02410 [Chitinophagaceae bacterium]
MKVIFLIAISLASSLLDTAQIEERQSADWKLIGKLHFGGITKAKMEYIASGTDTTYNLFIKDVRDMTKDNYFNISFRSSGRTFEKLYTILKSFFLPENKKDKKYTRTFNLGNTGVNVQHYRLLTGRGIMFYTRDGYTYLDEGDVDKLFGKN